MLEPPETELTQFCIIEYLGQEYRSQPFTLSGKTQKLGKCLNIFVSDFDESISFKVMCETQGRIYPRGGIQIEDLNSSEVFQMSDPIPVKIGAADLFVQELVDKDVNLQIPLTLNQKPCGSLKFAADFMSYQAEHLKAKLAKADSEQEKLKTHYEFKLQKLEVQIEQDEVQMTTLH